MCDEEMASVPETEVPESSELPASQDDADRVADQLTTWSLEETKESTAVYGILVNGAPEEVVVKAFDRLVEKHSAPQEFVTGVPPNGREHGCLFEVAIRKNYALLLERIFTVVDFIDYVTVPGLLVTTAVQARAREALLFLLGKGATVDMVVKKHEPGTQMVVGEHVPGTQLVVCSQNALHIAIMNKDWELAHVLLDNGATPDCGYDSRTIPQLAKFDMRDLATPLHMLVLALSNREHLKSIVGPLATFLPVPERADDDTVILLVQRLGEGRGASVMTDMILNAAALTNDLSVLKALIALYPPDKARSWATLMYPTMLANFCVHPSIVLAIRGLVSNVGESFNITKKNKEWVGVCKESSKQVPFKELHKVVNGSNNHTPIESAIARVVAMRDYAIENNNDRLQGEYSEHYQTLCVTKEVIRVKFTEDQSGGAGPDE